MNLRHLRTRLVTVRSAALLGMMLPLCATVRADDGEPAQAARREFFETKIRPVLAAHCQSCHGAQKSKGGLRVDWREPLRQGGESGPAIEPGQPEESLLLRVMEHSEPAREMPKGAPRLPEN